MGGTQWLSGLGAAVALLALLAMWWWLHRPLRPLVSGRGILDPSGRLGWIRWEEIEGAYHPSTRDRQGLRLRLHLSDRVRRRLRGRITDDAASTSPTVDVRLDLTGSDVSPAELLHRIVTRSAAAS